MNYGIILAFVYFIIGITLIFEPILVAKVRPLEYNNDDSSLPLRVLLLYMFPALANCNANPIIHTLCQLKLFSNFFHPAHLLAFSTRWSLLSLYSA